MTAAGRPETVLREEPSAPAFAARTAPDPTGAPRVPEKEE